MERKLWQVPCYTFCFLIDFFVAKIYANLGASFSSEGLPEVAIKYLTESLHMAQAAKDISQEIMATLLIAKVYSSQVTKTV